MSVADSPFDSAWKIAKAPLYHSVNIDLSDPEVADKLWALRDELMDEGITFDTGMGAGGRDWELDFSLKGANPDEVMIRMREAGIPFNTEMWYEPPDGELGSAEWATDDEGNKNPPHAVGIGESKCPECEGMAMIIRETDGSLTLACSDCGFMEEYQGGDFDEGVSKQFDQQRAEMARMQQAEQPPYVGDDEDLNLNIGGNQGECCEAFRQRMQGIFAGTPYDEETFQGGGVMGNSHQYWSEVINDEPCEEIISSWNDHVKDLLEWDMKQAFDPNGDSPPHYHIIKDMIEDTLQAIEEYEACLRGGFGGVDFGGDFMASGDVFEDSWNIAKFDAERAGMARMVEQEQIPAEDEEVEVNLDGGGGEPDKCCLEALQLFQELTGDYTQSNPWIWSKGVEGGTDGDGGGELDCDELRGWLEWVVYEDFDSPRDKEYQAAKKVLEQWESCISEDFSGDFTASGDVFEDAWSVAKKERCWLCEKVKDTYGRYPNLPYYPPNWKRPCDCAGDF